MVTGLEVYRSWKTKGEQGDAFALQQFEHYQSRPEFELYDLQNDPYELENLAGQKAYQPIQKTLMKQLIAWMEQQGDQGKDTEFEALTRKGIHDTKPPDHKP